MARQGLQCFKSLQCHNMFFPSRKWVLFQMQTNIWSMCVECDRPLGSAAALVLYQNSYILDN